MWRWAFERAQFSNAYFRAPETAAYIPEDFLGGSNRAERQHAEQLEKLTVMRANTQLQKMKRGVTMVDEVPAWAIGEYHG